MCSMLRMHKCKKKHYISENDQQDAHFMFLFVSFREINCVSCWSFSLTHIYSTMHNSENVKFVNSAFVRTTKSTLYLHNVLCNIAKLSFIHIHFWKWVVLNHSNSTGATLGWGCVSHVFYEADPLVYLWYFANSWVVPPHS
jgi:hypothetical protein